MKKCMLIILFACLLMGSVAIAATVTHPKQSSYDARARNFECRRTITVTNIITGDVVYELTAKLYIVEKTNHIAIYYLTDKEEYKRDFVYYNDYTIIVVREI